jgi:hypothetical protein
MRRPRRRCRDSAASPSPSVVMCTAGLHRADPQAAGRHDVGAEAVTGARRDARERDRHGRGQVAFFHAHRAEVHAGAGIDKGPGLELAVRDRVAYVHLVGARRDVPVDSAHVVLPGHVGPRVRDVGARTRHQPQVVPVQQPVDPTADDQLQPP